MYYSVERERYLNMVSCLEHFSGPIELRWIAVWVSCEVSTKTTTSTLWVEIEDGQCPHTVDCDQVDAAILPLDSDIRLSGCFSSFLPLFPPSDGYLASVSQCSSCHLAGRTMPGELLLASGGETQQARGGSAVSVWTHKWTTQWMKSELHLYLQVDWSCNRRNCVFLPLVEVVKSCSSSLWSSAATTRRKFWSRAPSTRSESASLSSRSVRLLPGCQWLCFVPSTKGMVAKQSVMNMIDLNIVSVILTNLKYCAAAGRWDREDSVP